MQNIVLLASACLALGLLIGYLITVAAIHKDQAKDD